MHVENALDYLPVERLRSLQLQRLRRTVAAVYENVPTMRKRMEQARVTPQSIESLEDICLLPFTTKEDLRDSYPFGLLARPLREIVRFHASSGTTGKPIVVAYTREDLEDWTLVMKRSLCTCGVHEGDIVQNAYGYGLFTGGLGFHYGAEALGASVIPISGGNTDRQIMLMRDFGVTVICCTPSYFLHIMDRAEELGVNLKDLPLRVGIFGAEPWTEAIRQRIQEGAGIRAYDIYGLSEMTGPGVAVECEYQDGLHLFEDMFYPEVVDPNTGQPLPPGQEGELVLTTLCKRAMPLLRYRTRDITALIEEPCRCGRTLRRIKRISRRTDDMLIIRGVNVFPSQIEAALLQVEGTLPHYQIIVERVRGLDELEVQVEVTAEIFSDTVGALERLRNKLSQALESIIGIRVKVTLVAPRTLERSQGKIRRVIDRRNM